MGHAYTSDLARLNLESIYRTRRDKVRAGLLAGRLSLEAQRDNHAKQLLSIRTCDWMRPRLWMRTIQTTIPSSSAGTARIVQEALVSLGQVTPCWTWLRVLMRPSSSFREALFPSVSYLKS